MGGCSSIASTPSVEPRNNGTTEQEAGCDIGVIGLGVMGSNLILNIAEKGFKVAVFNRTVEKTTEFVAKHKSEPFGANIVASSSMDEFVKVLKVPRKVLILVPAGSATDQTITHLTQVLDKNDIIVDTGNAHFKDQSRRAAELEGKGLRFLGMGISGGEEGARKGPAFFPGGTLSVWEEIRPIIEAAAAKAEDGRPCVTMNGSGGAGSCVKMYHNAGEYAILQLWGEAFNVLSDFGATNEEIAAIFEDWKSKKLLDSYMLDISIEAAKAKDTDGSYLTTKVMDRVGSKGTGLWSAQEALEIGCPAPSLNMAVISRQMSMVRGERIANAKYLKVATDNRDEKVTRTSPFVAKLYDALAISIIASYAQMFQCLREQDKVHNFGLNLPATIATFRAGCILKGYLLQPMTKAFEENKDLPNLMCAFGNEINAASLRNYREVLGEVTAKSATSIPVLSASLIYVNSMAQEVLKYGQLVSLQRDVFGRHGFERVDKEGKFNQDWPEMQ